MDSARTHSAPIFVHSEPRGATVVVGQTGRVLGKSLIVSLYLYITEDISNSTTNMDTVGKTNNNYLK